jgi:hypothetical protein
MRYSEAHVKVGGEGLHWPASRAPVKAVKEVLEDFFMLHKIGISVNSSFLSRSIIRIRCSGVAFYMWPNVQMLKHHSCRGRSPCCKRIRWIE